MLLKPFKVHSPDGKSFYRDESNPATEYTANVAQGAEAMQPLTDAILRRMLKDENRGDTVYRCGYNQAIENVRKILAMRSYLTAPPAQTAITDDARDAERYRWLRDTLHGAKAGGGVEVNDALQVYQQPVQGEEVRIYWYLHTPIGFHEITAATIDDAIDEGMADKDPQ